MMAKRRSKPETPVEPTVEKPADAESAAQEPTEPTEGDVAEALATGPKSYPQTKKVLPWERKDRKLKTRKFKVVLFGGKAKYEPDTFDAVDEGEALNFFLMKHGVRNAVSYRRRITPVDDNGN